MKSTPSQTPAGTASLSGFVYFDANQDGFIDPGTDRALFGVVIHLRGTNDLGDTVDLVTTTDINGAYSFTGLTGRDVLDLGDATARVRGRESTTSAPPAAGVQKTPRPACSMCSPISNSSTGRTGSITSSPRSSMSDQ